MSGHAQYLRNYAEDIEDTAGSEVEFDALRSAADHLEAVEGALRASTELLFRYTTGTNDVGTHRSSIEQIAANERLLGGGK